MRIVTKRSLRPWVLGSVACLAVICQRGSAVGTLSIHIGDIHAPAWTAREVAVLLDLSGPQPVARVSAARIFLSEAVGPLEHVQVTCLNPDLQPPRFRCRDARVSGVLGTLGKQSFSADVEYDSTRESLVFATRGLKLANGAVRLDGRWEGDTLEVRAAVDTLTTGNAEGTLAADKLTFSIDAVLKAAGEDWDINATVRAAGGQAYSDPVFVDFGHYPLAASFKGRWVDAGNLLRIDALEIEQRNVMRAGAAGELNLDALLTAQTAPATAAATAGGPVRVNTPAATALVRNLSITLHALEFPGAYATVLQPFLVDTALKDLTISGRVSGSVRLANDAPVAVDLALDDVTSKDAAGQLGIGGLRGRLVWTAVNDGDSGNSSGTGDSGDGSGNSYLAWDTATAYGLSGGGARLDFRAAGMNFALLRPTLLPIFDGGLQLHALRVRDFGSPRMSVAFDAEVKPISLTLLSQAFGWPAFAGTLAGRIPQVSYDASGLSVGGALEAQAFGGHIRVNGLRLRDPLGKYPRMNADITLRSLDLEAVTGTFSFGMITGRLDGDIQGLELFLWEPVRMDARLYTTPRDNSRHLISQRAVNNLSSIGGGGGGVAAALQTGVLKFFENFRYRHLGISCRLDNEVCLMDGIEPAADGKYYLVKGSGVPRIDIIGNNHRVDWPRLVAQLKAISESEGPVVQ